MDFPHGESVTIRSTVTTRDEFGDSTTVVTDIPWGPCAVAPRSSSESADANSPAVIVGLTIYGPTVALNSDDTLVVGGVVYEVDGIPGVWESPFTGWAPGMEVAVKRAAAV